MSAIALPMINSANVANPGPTGNSEPVNIEHCKSYAAVDIPDTANSSSTPKWQIVFKMLGSENQPSEIIWKYDDQGTRDADLALVEAASATTI
jgi:hypothetical protein